MFFGLIIKTKKRYSQTVDKSFHLSQASLDPDTVEDDKPVKVMLTTENQNFLLCTLRKGSHEQVPLDLNFASGDEISFGLVGSGTVHLTGFMAPDDYFESDGEDDEMASLNEMLGGKKAAKRPAEDDDEDDSDDDEAAGDDSEADDDDDDDDNEEGDDDEEEDDSESDEEQKQQILKQLKKKMKLDESSKSAKQNGLVNGKAQSKEDKKNKSKEEKPQKPQQQKQQQQAQKIGPTKLSNGVIIEDLRPGKGPEAKPGKKVQVYYEGRLKTTGKVFDSSLKGSGFKFLLGRGEVISGWDTGVAGMKVGGKRRIICPPSAAYGAKGSPPVIPANSTLVFDVELKNIA